MMNMFQSRILPFSLLLWGWTFNLCGQAMPVVPQPMIAPVWTRIQLGHVQPMGWLKAQMDQDLQGPIGKSDQLVPALYAIPSLFILNKLSHPATAGEAATGQAQITWWDGLIRYAILTKDKDLLARSEPFISTVLTHQEEDGYLGMYAPEIRFDSLCLHADLHYQATVLRILLNWYAYIQDPGILRSIELAVQQIYIHHPLRNLTNAPLNDQALPRSTAGLILCDVLFELYRTTGQQINKDLLSLFVKSAFPQMESPSILSTDWSDMSAESFQNAAPRWLAAAWSLTSDLLLKEQLDRRINDLRARILPSAASSDEPDLDTPVEYQLAALQELFSTYSFLLTLTADPSFAEAQEQLYMNALSGMWCPKQPAISCTQMDYTGRYPHGLVYHTGSDSSSSFCIASAGRVTPEYVQSLWYEDEHGFISSLFAPSEMHARFKDRQIRIQENTEFPGDHRIRYIVQTDSACTFILKIRKPKWARAITTNQPYTLTGEFVLIEKEWTGFDEIEVVFAPGISSYRTARGARWYTFGPLVLVHAIRPVESEMNPGSEAGIQDQYFQNVNPVTYSVLTATKPTRTFASDPEDLRFSLKARRSDTGIEETIQLVPLRAAALRQTIFPEYKP
ncbi:MAG: glycoside hydrolase family 127 protein [Saprospiraceae bacterium]|nr:glycoside hydrolase family 127 protein [Saprospiraceae bacterium]